MEKIIVFLPIIIFFGIFAILVVAFLGFVVKLVLKAKNSYWIGKVIDKKFVNAEDVDGNAQTLYHVVVQPDDGSREMKVALSRQMYDGFEIGDRIEKPKGALYPKKV